MMLRVPDVEREAKKMRAWLTRTRARHTKRLLTQNEDLRNGYAASCHFKRTIRRLADAPFAVMRTTYTPEAMREPSSLRPSHAS
jgi:hypothetical protein